MTHLARVTVRWPSSTQYHIESIAHARGVTSTFIIREAVDAYLLRHAEAAGSGGSPDSMRIALTSEFTQAGVDVLLRELAPGMRDEVLATVDQRMEKFHGKK